MTRRVATTLLEMLVAIAIACVLIALCISAAQRARVAASRAQCQNNLRQIGLALHNHETAFGAFPATVVSRNNATHGWPATLLPYLDQEPLAKMYDWNRDWSHPANHAVVAHEVPALNCASAPARVGPFGEATTDYAPFLELNPSLITSGQVDPPADTAGAFKGHARVPVAYIVDGTSNTIAISEMAALPELWLFGSSTGVPAGNGDLGAWGQGTPMILTGSACDEAARPGPCAINISNEGRAYSFHRGGVNAVFVDGSSRFISATIDIRTLAALVTRSGADRVSTHDFD